MLPNLGSGGFQRKIGPGQLFFVDCLHFLLGVKAVHVLRTVVNVIVLENPKWICQWIRFHMGLTLNQIMVGSKSISCFLLCIHIHTCIYSCVLTYTQSLSSLSCISKSYLLSTHLNWISSQLVLSF